jgi:hypothetical protein
MAIYATGSALSLVNNEFWQDFLTTARPAFKVPSTYLLANTLLNKEYDKIKEKYVECILNSDCLAVAADGWSNWRFRLPLGRH